MASRSRMARSRWALGVAMIAALAAFAPPQSSLDAAASAFASAWRSGSADAVVQNVASEGVRLTLVRESNPTMQARQARAAVAAFLTGYAAGRLEQLSARSLGVDPEQGSADFRWQTVASGTSESLSYKVFVSFVRSGNAWRITEIRVSP